MIINRTLYFVWKFLLKRFKDGNILWIFSKELRILPACEHCDKKFEIVLIALQKLSSQIYSKQASFAGIFKKEAKSLLLSVIVTLYSVLIPVTTADIKGDSEINKFNSVREKKLLTSNLCCF